MFCLPTRRALNPYAIFVLIFAAILAGFQAIIRLDLEGQRANVMAAAMLFDLIVFVPLAYWWLVGKSGARPITIVPIWLAGILFASLAFPSSQQWIVAAIREVFLPIVEVAVVVYIVVTVRQAARAMRTNQGFDRKIRIETAVGRLVGNNRLTGLLVAELTMFYYLFRLPARTTIAAKRIEAPTEAARFTYHKRSGIQALLFGFIIISLVELAAVHYLLTLVSHWAAWIATASSFYVCLMIVAQIRAVNCRPIFVHANRLSLVNGMIRLADIPLSSIETVEISRGEPQSRDLEGCGVTDKSKPPLKVSFPAPHNVIVYLNRDHEAELLYGKKRQFNVAVVHVDNPQAFVGALMEDLESDSP